MSVRCLLWNPVMRLISLLILSLFLSACSSMVNIDYDRSVNFKLFNTYRLQMKPIRVANDTRIDTPFMQQRIVKAIKSSLAKKGFEEKDKKDNLTVKYYLDIKHELETDESSVAVGFGSSGYHSAFGFGLSVPVGETYSVDKLVLTIDMVSTKTKKLLWRGSLASRLAAGMSPESNSKMINALVVEILENFPPK